MTKRRKQGIILLALSGPMLWFGFTNFIAGGINSTALSIGIAVACTFGIFCTLSGLVMLVTKNSLGILNPDDKGRGEKRASQTSEDSPILDKKKIEEQNQKAVDEFAEKIRNETIKEVLPMAKAKEFELADAVEEFRSLGEDIKKANLVVKTATEKRAVLRDNIAKNKFSINEDGKIDTIKK